MVEVIGRRARARLGSGRVVECRCAHGIDLPWLQAAVAVGPVDAELSICESGGSLWAVFPGPEHDDVLPEEVHVRASRRVKITSGAP